MVLDLEFGTFVFLNLVAIGTMLIGMFPRDKIITGSLLIVSMIVFFIIALFMIGEYDVVTVKTTTDGVTTWTEREMVISDANTGGIGYAYLGLWTLCFILLI